MGRLQRFRGRWIDCGPWLTLCAAALGWALWLGCAVAVTGVPSPGGLRAPRWAPGVECDCGSAGWFLRPGALIDLEERGAALWTGQGAATHLVGPCFVVPPVASVRK
ncbi:hypothetical protein NDU88_007259 [Pleurodeles waltl]|uniref:Uncharacterized protein n=1 Tax=Pleurodeles waltl TaxID=8319 RepID=A0AAV7PN86_PLEWA|nr:hypothetical protein NDU88_007259 [Pleurodeles waltl]